jgi:aryl-alcohol dehydrogenase
MQIQAAVLRDPDVGYKIETVDLPPPGPGQVLLRIAGVGMCHTDSIVRLGLTDSMPLIAGHEGAGVVEAVGPGVHELAVGDHAVASFDSCGACGNCFSGHPAYCDTFLLRNCTGRGLDDSARVLDANGDEVAARWFQQSSFATHAVTNVRNTVRVDTDLPIELLGPLACGVQTGAGAVLNVLDLRAGEDIVVFGAGAVGLSAIMAARVAGAARIIAVDLHESRLALAQELGATHVLRGDGADVGVQVRSLSGGGTRCALDTTGVPAVAATALGCIRTRGVLGLAGTPMGDVVLPAMNLFLGRRVVGIVEGDAVPQVMIPKLANWWRQGRFPFDRLVRKYSLDEINQAERDSLDGVVVKPLRVP